jgi:hypothetical protein
MLYKELKWKNINKYVEENHGPHYLDVDTIFGDLGMNAYQS